MQYQNARKIKNFLISPLIQFKFSAYIVVMILIYSIALGVYFYFSLGKFMDILVETSEVPELANEFAMEEIRKFMFGMGLIVFGMFIFSSCFIIIQTHRILGAAKAIDRHIRKNMLSINFSAKLTLRPKDYLKEIAQGLNQLSEKLADKIHEKKRFEK